MLVSSHRFKFNTHYLDPNASCQIPTFPLTSFKPSAVSVYFLSILVGVFFLIICCSYRCAEGLQCDLNYNNKQNNTDLDPSSLQPLTASLLSLQIGSHPLRRSGWGQGFFFNSPHPLFFLPIFIFTLWKTRRPSSSTAMASPQVFPFSSLNEGCPPRLLFLASPALGYSRGFAHLCSADSDHSPVRPLLLLLLEIQ